MRRILALVVVLLAFPGLEKAVVGKAPEIFTGPLRVAADGDFLSLPAGSANISRSRRF